MDTFLDNAQRIFEVARANESAESSDFALLVRPDGGLHMIMEASLSLEAAVDAGASTAYRVTRTLEGVRVSGRTMSRDCVFEDRAARRAGAGFLAELLKDQPLYSISSPLLTSC